MELSIAQEMWKLQFVTLHADEPKPTNVPKTVSTKINVGLNGYEAVLTGLG